MRSLLLRIFFSFWLIITLTIVLAAAVGYGYAQRARAAMENFQVSDAMLDASVALRDAGHEGLVAWLEGLPAVTAAAVFVLDSDGKDLLGRPLPMPVGLAMRRFGGEMIKPPMRGNLRPARPFSQLVGPDGQLYTLFVLPTQRAAGRWLAERGQVVLILLALLVSAAVSYLLARAISRPVSELRGAALSLADGKLKTRVPESVTRRDDEIGQLGQDFDRMARELDRAWQRQTELTRNVSHELRSPLARLRIALELARRQVGEQPEFAKIDLETERLNGLIGQILEFSRLDAQPEEAPETIDLTELLESVVQDVRYENQGKDDQGLIDLTSEGAHMVSGYPGALRSAFENVLRNAVLHGQGAKPVTVKLSAIETEAQVVISDSGAGVSDEDLAQLFQPFFRSANAAESPASGSGLGLAIASRAIELNRGTISVRNTGSGLEFTITFPK
ncbi:MAG: ATP-binding protein [Pseudomonadota bacterium]